MPRKASRATEPETEPGTAAGMGEAMGDGNESPSSLFDNMAGDTYIVLRRRHDVTKMWEYVGRLDPTQATEEHIAETYGGGNWQAQEKVRGQNGLMVWGRQRTFSIAGPFKGIPKAPPAPAPVTAGPIVRDVDGTERPLTRDMMDSLLLNQMMDMMKAQREASTALIESFRSRGVDWGTILPAVIPLITAWMTRPKETDPIDKAREIAALIAESAPKGPPPATSPLKERLEELQLLRDLSGEGGAPETMPGILARAMPSILEALGNAKAQDAATPAARALPTPAPREPNVILTLLRQYVPLLHQQAVNGSSPERYAAVVWDQVPRSARPAFRRWLVGPTAWADILAVYPAVQQYGPWWTQLLEHLRQVSAPVPVVTEGLDTDAEGPGPEPTL